MKVYRDCLNGVPPFDGFPDSQGNIVPAYFTIYDVYDNPIISSSFTALSFITVPPTNNSPCAPTTAGNACVEEALYETTVNLPPVAGGYYVVYQRCCRNATILNLISPGGVGATYWQHIPGPEVVAINNSPRFTKRPPIYICKGLPIAFDHSAIDPDGDSLVYSLCNPYDGLDACCPTLNSGVSGSSYCTNPPSACPSVNPPQPYLSVPFVSPYSSSYPMSSSPAININPTTGFLDGVPNIIGQWVVGVCVSEYRHGQLIDVHHRDFQFNVINCPFVVSADIISQTTTNNGQGTGFCNGFTISYSNNSFNGTTYHWDFGDPLSTSDTSNAFNPTYTFNTAGIYTVTLIVNPGSTCGDTTTEVFQIHPLLSPDYITPSAQCFNGNSFTFNGAGAFQGNGTFNWNFGTNATPQSATTLSATSVSFNTPGVYPVIYTVSENGCTASVTKTVQVFPNPIASIGNFITSGCAPLTVTFPNLSTAGSGMTYLWNFSNGSTSTAASPVITFTNAGVYTVSLTIITNQQCIDTSQVTAVNSITVANLPTSLFSITPSTVVCFNNNNFNFINNSITQGPATYSWNFGLNASQQTSTSFNVNNVSYNASGTYVISLSVNEAGCVNASIQTVQLYANPLAAIGAFPTRGCSPFTVNFTNQSTAGNSMNYQWNFSDGSSSTLSNPSITFSNEGVYSVSLTVSTNTGCIASNSITAVNTITVTETPTALFNSVSAFGLCFKNNSFNFTNSSLFFGNVTHSWDFGIHATPQNATSFNVQPVTFDAPGTYTVVLSENKNGCIDTATSVIELYNNPIANLGHYPYSGCDPLMIQFVNASTSDSPLTYLWTFSDGATSTLANPTHIFSPPGTYGVSLTVSTTSKCIDVSNVSSIHPIVVYPIPTASFNVVDDDYSTVTVTNHASSDAIAWHYEFGDGATSPDKNPTHFYTNVDIFNIVQTVTNSYGCIDTYTVPVVIVPDFGFWIPNAFTPEKKDGLNDIFKPVIFGVEDYQFMVFNRWGEMIYQTDDINAGWNGTFKGADSPQDVYVWKCEFKNKISEQFESHVGHVTLVR